MKVKIWGKKLLLSLILIISVYAMYFPYFALAKEKCTVNRIYGNDRYETSVAISREGWGESNCVVLAAGDEFADAIAGSTIAYKLDAPILLTEKNGLSKCIKEEIIRLKAKKALLLGGPSAINHGVEKELSEMNVEVERLWGTDRYETSLKVAEKFWTITRFSEMFITTGEEFQYAMTIAPFASRNNMPLLFSLKDSMNENMKESIRKLGITRVHIIGNNEVINDTVKEELVDMNIDVRRIGGDSIQDTNINVIRRYYMGKTNIGIAREDMFADALSGCSFSALKDMPILLTNKDCPSSNAVSFLNKKDFERAYIFGGKYAVSDYIVYLLKKEKPIVPCDGILIKDAFQNDGKKVAFLTFDDGPSKNVTPAILDILKENEIKATFFIVGQMAKSNEGIVKRIFSEGHSIGNHSYSHEYSYLYRSIGSFLSEISKWEKVLKDILGEDFEAKLFRFPGGSFGSKLSNYKKALSEDGYDYINWNALTGDAEGHNVSSQKLIKRLKDTVSGKDRVVILMHDLGSKKTTVEALPSIIEYLKSQGYEFKKLI